MLFTRTARSSKAAQPNLHCVSPMAPRVNTQRRHAPPSSSSVPASRRSESRRPETSPRVVGGARVGRGALLLEGAQRCRVPRHHAPRAARRPHLRWNNGPRPAGAARRPRLCSRAAPHARPDVIQTWQQFHFKGGCTDLPDAASRDSEPQPRVRPAEQRSVAPHG